MKSRGHWKRWASLLASVVILSLGLGGCQVGNDDDDDLAPADMTTLPQAEILQTLMTRYYQTLETHDLSQVMAFFSPDVQGEITALPPLNGVVALRAAYFEPFNQGFPDNRHTVQQLSVSGNTVSVQFIFEGTYTGSILGLPATGKAIKLPIQGTYTIHNNQITRIQLHYENRLVQQTIGALATEYAISSTTLHPEGIAFDPKSRSFFVSSLGEGSITQIEGVMGKESLFYQPSASGWQSAGLKVDAQNQRLWACIIRAQPQVAGAILVFDIPSKTLLKTYDLTQVQSGAACNDLVLDSSGVAYVSDHYLPNLYKIDFNDSLPRWFAQDLARWTPSQLPGSGLNGLAITPDGQWLIVAKYDEGKLFRVSLAQPSLVMEIELMQPGFVFPVDGPDGMLFLGNELYLMSGSKLRQVTFSDPSFLKGQLKTLNLSNGFSTIALAEGQIYMMQGYAFEFIAKPLGLPVKIQLPFKIVRADLSQLQ